MLNPFYMPHVANARFVRMYFFRHPQQGPSSCALVTDCQSYGGVQYAHAMYVYEGGDILIGKPVWAVTSEVNRMASEGGHGSHFLCMFQGGAHHNLGAADDWADIETFATKALQLVTQHYSLSEPPREIPVPTVMLQRYRVPGANMAADPAGDRPPPESEAKTHKWWQFWK